MSTTSTCLRDVARIGCRGAARLGKGNAPAQHQHDHVAMGGKQRRRKDLLRRAAIGDDDVWLLGELIHGVADIARRQGVIPDVRLRLRAAA